MQHCEVESELSEPGAFEVASPFSSACNFSISNPGTLTWCWGLACERRYGGWFDVSIGWGIWNLFKAERDVGGSCESFVQWWPLPSSRSAETKRFLNLKTLSIFRHLENFRFWHVEPDYRLLWLVVIHRSTPSLTIWSWSQMLNIMYKIHILIQVTYLCMYVYRGWPTR